MPVFRKIQLLFILTEIVVATTVPTVAVADDGTKTYEVIRDNRGIRQGTIQGDGVTNRLVVYDNRGRRIGTIDPEPDYSQPEGGAHQDDIDTSLSPEIENEERDGNKSQ